MTIALFGASLCSLNKQIVFSDVVCVGTVVFIVWSGGMHLHAMIPLLDGSVNKICAYKDEVI